MKVAAAGVLPESNGLVQLASAQDPYNPEFFSKSQLNLLDSLPEVILPADDHSRGARAAKVARSIDVMVADGPSATQRRWRSGLKAVSELTKKRFKCNVLECDARQQDEIVAEISLHEDSPRNEADRFFILAKRATIDRYYTSQIGIHEDLG